LHSLPNILVCKKVQRYCVPDLDLNKMGFQ
jgi:hypothetical protein